MYVLRTYFICIHIGKVHQVHTYSHRSLENQNGVIIFSKELCILYNEHICNIVQCAHKLFDNLIKQIRFVFYVTIIQQANEYFYGFIYKLSHNSIVQQSHTGYPLNLLLHCVYIVNCIALFSMRSLSSLVYAVLFVYV